MTVQKDNIYEFGFGRSDQVSKNVNLLDEAVFSFLYGGLFKVLKSLALTSLLDLEIERQIDLLQRLDSARHEVEPRRMRLSDEALGVDRGEEVELEEVFEPMEDFGWAGDTCWTGE